MCGHLPILFHPHFFGGSATASYKNPALLMPRPLTKIFHSGLFIVFSPHSDFYKVIYLAIHTVLYGLLLF